VASSTESKTKEEYLLSIIGYPGAETCSHLSGRPLIFYERDRHVNAGNKRSAPGSLFARGQFRFGVRRRHYLIGGALVRRSEIKHVPAPVKGDLDENASREMFLDVPSGARH